MSTDPEYDVHAGPGCRRRVSYGTHYGRGCQSDDPCAACTAAKEAARAARIAADRARGDQWLAGMSAREARVLQIRREMRWSSSRYPTDLEQLDAVEIDARAAGLK